MDKIVWLDRSLIIAPVYYTLCKNKQEFKKVLKHLGIKKKDAPDYLNRYANATVHYFEKDKNVTCVVCLGSCEGRKHSEIVGLLIHESVHIWQEIKDIIGERNPSKEFEAYSIQCIAQRLIEAYDG